MMQQSNPQSQSFEKTDGNKKNDPYGMMHNNLVGGVNPSIMPGKKIPVFVNYT